MSAKIGFMIEEEIWEDDEAPLLATLTEKKVPYVLHPCEDFDPFVTRGPLLLRKPDVDALFCYGSLQWIFQIRHEEDERLKVFCSLPCFNCSVYYYYFHPYLFNRNYHFLPLYHFVENFDRILAGHDGKLFMRPATGFKSGSISGGIFDQQLFKEYISFFEEGLDKDALVVVSSAKHIDYEWRTIICQGQCITGCQYRSFDQETQRLGFDPSPDFPDRVKEKAQFIASAVKWAPDDMYVLDMVESNGKLSVVEINALSTSGWYDCDTSVIIDSVLKLLEN